MEDQKLWLLNKGREKKMWFYVGEPNCEVCKKDVILGYYFTNWHKNNHHNKFLCSDCAREVIKLNMHMQEYKLAHTATEPPVGSVIGGSSYPGLVNTSNMSTFEAAEKNISGEDTIDKTKLSGRSKPVEVEYIGDLKAIEDGKDESLDEKRVDDLLDSLLNAEPVLPETKNLKQIEDNKK